jgi:glycosyltransferase involved in cell wall biosynthesis
VGGGQKDNLLAITADFKMKCATPQVLEADQQPRRRPIVARPLRTRLRSVPESLVRTFDPNQRLRVYVPGPHRFVRPNNTDWRYTQMLGQLGDFDQRLDIIPEHSWIQMADTNLKYMLGVVAGRMHLELPKRLCYGLAQYRSLSRRELSCVRPDVVFAYERYPRPTSVSVPILWMTGPIPEHCFHMEENQSAIQKEIAWKRECANHAGQVICSTTFAKMAFCRQIGFDPHRVHVVPFLLPHLGGGGRSRTSEKGNEKLRCLFVGREAVRKGLPRALEILKAAPHWSLHVISSFSDGRVDLPSHATHQHAASRQEVLDWMAKSDLLFSLSEYDSFGFAAVEAASRQCVPVFRAGSIQETMFSPSAALFLRDAWTPKTSVEAIENKLVVERQATQEAVLSEFRTNFSPETVAREIYLLGLNAIQCRKTLIGAQQTNRVEESYADEYARMPQAV